MLACPADPASSLRIAAEAVVLPAGGRRRASNNCPHHQRLGRELRPGLNRAAAQLGMNHRTIQSGKPGLDQPAPRSPAPLPLSSDCPTESSQRASASKRVVLRTVIGPPSHAIACRTESCSRSTMVCTSRPALTPACAAFTERD